MRAERRWASNLRTSARAGDVPPLPILAGFAEHYEVLAANAHTVTEAAAVLLETRAENRGSETVAAHLRAAAEDLRAGFHLHEQPPMQDLHRHSDGEEYIRLGTCAIKDDETGEWCEGVAYRAVSGPRHDVLCVTSQQRWDDRFTPVEPEVDDA